jgi:hypothetical protein
LRRGVGGGRNSRVFDLIRGSFEGVVDVFWRVVVGLALRRLWGRLIVDFDLFDPVLLQVLHGRVVSATDATALLVVLTLPTPLAGMEVCTSEMGGGIVVRAVYFLVTAVLTVGEELLVV